MTTPISLPSTNDIIAGRIIALIATTVPSELQKKIETLLNESYPSRRKGSASTATKGASRISDADTSIEAANKVNVTKSHRLLLRALTTMTNPATAEETCVRAGIRVNSGSTRFAYLVKVGYVEIVGTVIDQGRRKRAYKITPKGQEWLNEQYRQELRVA